MAQFEEIDESQIFLATGGSQNMNETNQRTTVSSRTVHSVDTGASPRPENNYSSLMLDEKGKTASYVNDDGAERGIDERRMHPDAFSESQRQQLSLQPESHREKYMRPQPVGKDAKYLSPLPDDKNAKYLSLLPDDKDAKYLSLLPDDKDAKYLSLMTEHEEGYERLSNKPDVCCTTAGGRGVMQQRQLPPLPNYGIYETIKPNKFSEGGKNCDASSAPFSRKRRCRRLVAGVCILAAAAIFAAVSYVIYFYLQGEFRVFCFYTSSARLRPANGTFVPEDIDVTRCTHLVYTHAKIENGRLGYVYADEDDNANYPNSGFYSRFNRLKDSNPRLKTLLSVGGDFQDVAEIRRVLDIPNGMRAFVDQAVRFLRRTRFDGMDFSWIYPTLHGSSDSDRDLYAQWLLEIRRGFDEEKRARGHERLLLMATVSPGEYIIDYVYDVPSIAEQVDFLHVRGFNIHFAANDAVTAHHSPLYAARNNTLIQYRDRQPPLFPTLSQDWALQHWLLKGAPREKIVLGLSFSARSFTLANARNHSIGAPHKPLPAGYGRLGRHTNETGMLSYYEVCENLADGWQSVYDKVQQAVYAFKGDQWVSYDNERSIAAKAEYVRKLKIAGVSVVSVDYDDFRGTFCNGGHNPLLSTVSKILRNR